MPSFDTVLEPNLVEVRNAVEQANKEIGTRFDFKGSDARIELGDKEFTLYADSDFQLGQVMDILLAKLTKRQVDARFLDRSAKPEKIGGDKLKQRVVVKAGIDSDAAKKIQGLIKQSKMKVQAAIQGDVVRVSGAKRDEQFALMIETACRFEKPVRIGVNWGSLDAELLARMMDDNGRLPGSILLASPCICPYRFGTPIFAVKSSISSFSSTPVFAAVTRAPNQSFSV